MTLTNDPLPKDPHFLHHEQSHIPNEVVRQLVVGDTVGIDVEAEALTLKSSAVREIDLEVEFDTPVIATCQCSPPPRSARPAGERGSVKGCQRQIEKGRVRLRPARW
jgi:hypothetical protein